jgi:peptidoglycan/LPS O-acetylase OafA/YrhL
MMGNRGQSQPTHAVGPLLKMQSDYLRTNSEQQILTSQLEMSVSKRWRSPSLELRSSPVNKLIPLGMVQKLRNDEHIGALDGLRGAAFLLVFAFHSLSGNLRTDTAFSSGLSKIVGLGWMGVDLFFVLSGFLITSILLKARDSENYYKVFYARRALRILPLYYLVLIISLALAHHHYPWNIQVFFWLNLSNLLTAFNPMLIPQLTHYWSLAIEEQFYLVWPAVVKRLQAPTLFKLCLSMIVLLLVVRNIPVVQALSLRWDNLLYRLTPFRLDTLCGGALLAVLVQKNSRNLAALEGKFRASFVVSSSALLYLCWSHPGLISRFGFTLIVVCFTSLVALCLHPGIISKVFSLGILKTTGRYSYCLYLIHLPFLMATSRFQSRLSFKGNTITILYSLVQLCVLFGISALSYKFIEFPILGLKKHFRYKRPQQRITV